MLGFSRSGESNEKEIYWRTDYKNPAGSLSCRACARCLSQSQYHWADVYRWRNKYGGMDVSEAKRLKALEHENAELKKIVADLTLDNRMLRDVNAKKW